LTQEQQKVIAAPLTTRTRVDIKTGAEYLKNLPLGIDDEKNASTSDL
jgi:hypothetical protein